VGIQDLSGATRTGRWIGSQFATGTREPGEHDADQRLLESRFGHDAARAPAELIARLACHQRAALWRVVRKMGFRRKKNRSHAIERDTEINRRRRKRS